jgi:hypothetical protein
MTEEETGEGRIYIQIHNKKTGSYEDVDFTNIDDAFDFYWELTDKNDPDIVFELIEEL